MSLKAPLTDMIEADVAAVTIAADLTTPVGEAPFDGVISAVEYIPTAAITGANSPASRTFALYNRGQAGSGTTKAAELAMVSGVDAAANDSKEITLSGTPANLAVVAGDVLDWESLHIGGTGLVDPGGTVQVTIARS